MAETPWSPFTTYFLGEDGSIVIDQNPETLIPDNQGSSYDLLTEPLGKIQEYIRKIYNQLIRRDCFVWQLVRTWSKKLC